MEDKQFLINLLNLSEGILNMNNTKIIEITNELNSVELTDEQKGKVKNTITSFLDNIKENAINTLKLTINSLSMLNKNYLLSLVDIRTIKIYDNSIEAKKLVENKLKDNSISFDNSFDKYTYYSMLVSIAINLRDANLIKIAIDNVQAI